MPSERRDLYRVKPDSRDAFSVALVDDTRTWGPAEVVDLSARGAGARVARESWPRLEPGEEVTLAFSSPRFDETMRVRAALAKAEDDEGMQHYGFQFLAESALARALPAEMFRLFNRRGAHRARDLGPSSVEMRPHLDGRGALGDVVIARIKTLSTGGLGALGPVEELPQIANADSVTATMLLPGTAEPLRVVAWIRNRETYREATYYGLEFDAQRTPDFLDVAEDIVAFVMERMDPGVAGTPH